MLRGIEKSYLKSNAKRPAQVHTNKLRIKYKILLSDLFIINYFYSTDQILNSLAGLPTYVLLFGRSSSRLLPIPNFELTPTYRG